MNNKVKHGCTTLHMAAWKGNPEKVSELLEGGANVNVKDNFDQTPLIFASMKGELKVAQVLVDAGADLQAMNKWNNTALNLAKTEVAAFLRSKGAT